MTSGEQRMANDEQRERNRQKKTDLEERLIDMDFREERSDGTTESQKTFVNRNSSIANRHSELRMRIDCHSGCAQILGTMFDYTGIVKRKVLPLPFPSLSAQILPPCNSTSCLVNDRPNPVP